MINVFGIFFKIKLLAGIFSKHFSICFLSFKKPIDYSDCSNNHKDVSVSPKFYKNHAIKI